MLLKHEMLADYVKEVDRGFIEEIVLRAGGHISEVEDVLNHPSVKKTNDGKYTVEDLQFTSGDTGKNVVRDPIDSEDMLPDSEFDDQYRLVQLMSDLNDEEVMAMIESLVWLASDVMPARLQGEWHNENEKPTYKRIAELILHHLD